MSASGAINTLIWAILIIVIIIVIFLVAERLIAHLYVAPLVYGTTIDEIEVNNQTIETDNATIEISCDTNMTGVNVTCSPD